MAESTRYHTLMNKSIILLIVLNIIYLSSQCEINKNILSLKNITKNIVLEKSVFENETFGSADNYRAKYIQSKLEIFNKSADSSQIQIYPYHRYRYAILRAIDWLKPKDHVSIMIISTNCKLDQTYKLMDLIKDYNDYVYCVTFQTNNFKPSRILESYTTFRVDIAVLLLPRLFIQTLIETLTPFHLESFYYITVDLVPGIIRQIQRVNQLLTFSNLNLVKASDVFNRKLMSREEPTECSVSGGEIFFDDSFHVYTCRYYTRDVIRIVTIFFNEFVFPLPDIFPYQGKCDRGLTCLVHTNTDKKTICCGGRYIDILSIVLKDVKFPYTLYVVDSFGSHVNGSWSGIINEIYEGDADLAVAPLTVTQKRFQIINYVFERSKRSEIGIMKIRPSTDPETINFTFVPDNAQYLIGYLVALHLAVILIVYIFESIAFKQNYGQKYNLKDTWSFVGAIWFQRDLGGLATVSWSGRILAILYAFGMTILISAYTATLTANNIDYEDTRIFRGLRDKMFKNPSMRVGIFRNSYYEGLMDRYKHTCKRVDIDDYSAAAKLLIERKLDAVIGAIDDMRPVFMSNNDYCKKLILKADEKETEDFSWGYNKKSTFGKMISLSLLRLMIDGAFKGVHRKWSAVSSCNRKLPKQYPWQYAMGLVLCLVGTVGVCVIILILETIFIKMKKKQKRSSPVSYSMR